jgi:hypothetical protein
MPDTALGITYPSTTSAVNVPGDLGVLAADVDALLTLLVTKPRFKIVQTVAQAFATATWTSVSFDAEDAAVPDTANGHDNVTNNSRYTVQAGHGGLWLISGKMAWANSTVNRRQTRYRINGATVIVGSETASAPASSGPQSPGPAMMMNLVAGDYIEMQAAQDSGGSLNSGIFGADTYPFLTGVRLSS